VGRQSRRGWQCAPVAGQDGSGEARQRAGRNDPGNHARAATGSPTSTVTAEDDLLVSYLEGDFRGVSRLDLVVQVEDGPEHRMFDLPVSPSSAELIVAQAMPALRAMPSSTMRMRLHAREGEGDRLVGEYTFAHMASATGRE
jgi:hypothetical protein